MARNTLFQQLFQLLLHYDFKKCINRYEWDKYTKCFNCCQLAYQASVYASQMIGQPLDSEISLSNHYNKTVLFWTYQCCQKHIG